MWRVCRHTGKVKDYEVYKEALNAATNEVRKSKRNFEHKLAQNIKLDSKSSYAYGGNIITKGFLIKFALQCCMHERIYEFVTCNRNKWT